MSKCTYIRLEFDDGTVKESRTPEDAQDIHAYWENCSALAQIHGMKYQGPFLVERSST